jgi:hypothetical protein
MVFLTITKGQSMPTVDASRPKYNCPRSKSRLTAVLIKPALLISYIDFVLSVYGAAIRGCFSRVAEAACGACKKILCQWSF